MPKKGDKFVRKTPRQRGNTDIRPFKAPRLVTKDINSNNNTEVQAITETENARDLDARQDKDEIFNPYPNGIKMMSYREATECAEYGEVLRWSPDIESEQTIEKTPPQSDTTGSTPEMFKSPEINQDRVPGFISENHPELTPTVVEKTVAPRKYKGWVYIQDKIPETEVQESSVNQDKEDTSLTLSKIQDLREGPKGEGAVGKIVAKVFDGVEY